MTTEVTTGADLILSWDRRHRIATVCPRCADPVMTVAMVNLVYTHEVCSCGTPNYAHLVETLYHRACFQPQECTEFRPFWVRGRRGSLGHNTQECHECGRLERSHRPVPVPS